jgi:hypothetical protein
VPGGKRSLTGVPALIPDAGPGWETILLQALRAAAESVGPRLPIEATAAEVILMAGPRPGTPDTPPGQWRTIAAFPLG